MPQSAPCLDGFPATSCHDTMLLPPLRSGQPFPPAQLLSELAWVWKELIIGYLESISQRISQDTSHSTSCSGDIGTNFPVVFATCPDVASHQKAPKPVGNRFVEFHQLLTTHSNNTGKPSTASAVETAQHEPRAFWFLTGATRPTRRKEQSDPSVHSMDRTPRLDRVVRMHQKCLHVS